MAVFVPVVLQLCAVWMMTSALLWLGGRRTALGYAVWSLLLAALPIVVLKNGASVTAYNTPHTVLLATAFLPGVLLLVLLWGWQSWGCRWFLAVREFVATLLGFFAVLGVLILIELAWFGWRARDLNDPIPLHHTGTSLAKAPAGRVIWILMDELSYQQVYERRSPSLQLPEFDRLAAESTIMTHTKPAGDSTSLVIPALITGYPADELKASDAGKLVALYDAKSSSWHPFDADDTVFGDALKLGYSTAVAGWFNPYCRILPSVLDHCFWVSRMPFEGEVYGDESLAHNLMAFPDDTMLALSHVFDRRAAAAVYFQRWRKHLADYKDLVAAGDADLADGSASFVFLHIPVPHPGGIFNRRSKEFSIRGTSYLDNLALADAYLAHVRKMLEQRGEWDKATVILMGDHSWRTRRLWNNAPEWTVEDQVASHGGEFDDRPAYVVKLPGQKNGATIDSVFPAMRTRALLDALLAGQLRSSDDLKAWVKAGQ